MPTIVPEALQNQIVSVVRKGNEATVGRVKTAVGSVKTAKIPSTPKTPEGKLDVAKLRQGTVDYAGKLPTPVSVVEGAFGLVDRAVEQQRKIVGTQRQRAGAVITRAASVLRPAAADEPATDAKPAAKAEAGAKQAPKAAAKPAAPKAKPAKAASAK